MKKFIIIYTLAILGLLFWVIAEDNAANARDAAGRSDGSDASIEVAMAQYGFNLNASRNEKPSIIHKFTALFK